MRPPMPNKEELLNETSTEKTQAPNEPLRISQIGFKYAYCQIKLPEETSKSCNFGLTGGNMNGYHRLKKGLYCLSDIPTIFQNVKQNIES